MPAFNEKRSNEQPLPLLFENGVLIYSGSADPTGSPAPQWSRYWRTNGEIWLKSGAGDNDWLLIGIDGLTARGRNTITMFASGSDGEGILSGAYAATLFSPIGGPDSYVNPVFTLGVLASTAVNGTVDVRLTVKATAQVLATLSWDNEVDPVLKEDTIIAPNGVNILEVQTKKTGGSGKLYTARIEVTYGSLP